MTSWFCVYQMNQSTHWAGVLLHLGEFQDLSAWMEMSRAFSESWFAE